MSTPDPGRPPAGPLDKLPPFWRDALVAALPLVLFGLGVVSERIPADSTDTWALIGAYVVSLLIKVLTPLTTKYGFAGLRR